MADKVHDGDVLLVIADADVHWEMGIHELHLVLVALGHAGEKILDVRANSLNGGKLLLLAEPFVDGDGVGILVVLDVDVHVLERLGEGTAISSHDNDTGFDTDGDAIGDLDHGLLVDGLHVGGVCLNRRVMKSSRSRKNPLSHTAFQAL